MERFGPPHPAQSGGIAQALPERLFLLADGRATAGTDVVESFLVEQHQQQALAHRHGSLALLAVDLAHFQGFKISSLGRTRRHFGRYSL